MKKIFHFVLSFFIFVKLFAVPATPSLLTKIEPDGSILKYYLLGDEFFSYQTTQDSCLIQENTQGFFEYAMMDEDGSLRSIGVKVGDPINHLMLQSPDVVNRIVHSVRQQIQADRRRVLSAENNNRHKFPLSGSPKSLVILAEFSDVAFTVPNTKNAFSNLLNEQNYSTNGGVGSAKDYFKASSNGVFSPNFIVVGPYKLPNNQKYYGEPNGSQKDKRATQMIIDACIAADADIDFSEYDTDNNGVIDNVFVYYSGHNEAEGGSVNTIWPHRFRVYDNIVFDGKRLNDYACTSELSGSSGTRMCGIGTFSHEFGHVLGLPDYYDTSNNRNNPNVPGAWNIMSSGSYNGDGKTPPAYSAEDRFYLGWLQPIQIESGGQFSLSSLNTSNSAYLLTSRTSNLTGNNPDPVEYFLLENRQHDGWDTPSTCIYGTGMLITHINYSAQKWRYNNVNNDLNAPGYLVVRADDSSSSQNLSGDPFPGSRRVNSFEPTLQNGQKLKLPLSNIFENGSDIIFSVAGGDGRGLNVSSVVLNFVAPYTDNTGRNIIEDQFSTIKLVGKKLTEPVEVYFEFISNYKLKQEDGTFSTTKRIIPLVKDSVDIDLEIQFDPSFISCSKKYSDRLVIKSGQYLRFVQLNGTTPRKNILVAPQLQELTIENNTNISMQWNAVNDADYYYVSVQDVEEEPKIIKETFDNFGKAEFSKIWKSNFLTSSKLSPKSPPIAVWFRNNKDQLTSPVYYAQLTSLSYWLRSNSAEGQFIVEGKNNEKWDTIAVENITQTLTNKTFSYDFDASNTYEQFRMTYLSEGVGSGVTFDDFILHSSKTKTSVIKRQEVNGQSFKVEGLKGGKIYYFYVEAAENKGCEMHYSPLSNIQRIQLEGGNDVVKENLSLSYEGKDVIINIIDYDSTRDNGRYILIYDIQGHLIFELPVQSNSIILPPLLKGSAYIAVFTNKDKQAKNATSITFYY